MTPKAAPAVCIAIALFVRQLTGGLDALELSRLAHGFENSRTSMNSGMSERMGCEQLLVPLAGVG